MFKRAFDLVAATFGLLLFGVPMLAMAAWIRLDSPGSVFFRQERVGRHGTVFRIHKFRTMTADADRRGPPLTVGADARVTRAGRVLRATRLDELPQFLDVLAGDKSLVGPRPDVPRCVYRWPSHLRKQVLAVRPDITDPASLKFRARRALESGESVTSSLRATATNSLEYRIGRPEPIRAASGLREAFWQRRCDACLIRTAASIGNEIQASGFRRGNPQPWFSLDRACPARRSLFVP